MRNKILNVIMLMAFISPVSVYALGLGELTLRSYLSQPLAAEVALIGVESGDAEVIQARLASSATHKKAGLERPFSLVNLKFAVEETANGVPFIRIFTERAVADPYFNFLIEVSGPEGRVFREYTMLLDPPPHAKTPPVSITQIEIPAVVRAAAEPGSVGADLLAMPEVATIDGKQYGPTAIGDTLWEIAIKVRPVGVNVNQAMIAIVAANPDAFIDNNINLMFAGKVLRLPDQAGYQTLDVSAARDEFARHQDAWKQFKQNSPAVAPPIVVVDSSSGEVIRQRLAESTPVSGQTEAVGRVRLVGAALGDETAVAVRESAGSSAQVSEHIELLEEALEVRERENQDLREQINQLELRLATLREMAELAKLAPGIERQGGVAGSETSETRIDSPVVESIDEPAAKVLEDLDNAAELAPSDEPVEITEADPSVDEGVISPEVKADPPVEDKDERKRPSGASPVKSSAADGGLIDLLLANWIYLVAAVTLLVLGFVGLALRSGKKNEVDSLDELDLDDEEQTLVRAPAVVATEETELSVDQATSTLVSDVDALEDTTSFLDDFVAPSVGVAAEAELEDVDPIAEADVFIAYGHHEQAEEIIQDAIQYDDRLELKLKLLDIYYSQDKGDEYEQFAGELKGLQSDDSGTWEKISALGLAIKSGSDLFSGSTLDVSQIGSLVAASTVQDELDLDAEGDEDTSLELSEAVDDFDLGDFAGDETETADELSNSFELDGLTDGSLETGATETDVSDGAGASIELDVTEISTSIELDGLVGEQDAADVEDLADDAGGLEFDLSPEIEPESLGAESEGVEGSMPDDLRSSELSTTMDLDAFTDEVSAGPEGQVEASTEDEGSSLEFDLSGPDEEEQPTADDVAEHSNDNDEDENTINFDSLDFDDESPTEESSSTPQDAAPEVQIDEEAIVDFELDIAGDENEPGLGNGESANLAEIDESHPGLDVDDEVLGLEGTLVTNVDILNSATADEPLVNADSEETQVLDSDDVEASLEIQFDEVDDEVELLDQEASQENDAEFTLEDGGLDPDSGEELSIDMELDAANESGDIELKAESNEEHSAELTIELTDVDADISLDDGLDPLGESGQAEVDEGEADLSFDLDDELDDGLDETVISFAPVGQDADSETVETLDAVASQLDLLAAYVDMGDRDQASTLNERIQQHGNDDQKRQAAELIAKLEE
ncbi:MAG: hypothetical protein JKY89_03220 [Immundisolibacteraceae bacterium]|nr:hypothetical protein [Immundisolibacteraceae bacterium]